MKFLERLFPKIEPRNYSSCEGLVVTVKCPQCAEFIDIDSPDDDPPTGQRRGEGWCWYCGKRFVFYY
jgi:hypothetical protein